MTRYRCDDPTCPVCRFVTGPDVLVRPAHKMPPLVAGGQGRSDAQVENEGVSVVAWVVIALAIGAIGFMIWLAGRL